MPQLSNLRLAEATDSGAKGDGITDGANGNELLRDVTGARTGNFTGEVLNGARPLNTPAFAPLADGVTLPKPADGTNALTLRLTDAAGNTATTADPFALVVDSVAPALPVFALAPGVDDGARPDDRYFNTTQPAFDITVPADEDMVLTWVSDIHPGGRAAIALTAGSTARHILDVGIAGTHRVDITVTVAAGNSTTGTLRPFMVDTSALNINEMPRIAALTDSGTRDDDAITNIADPVIEMLLSEAEARYNDGTVIGPWAAADSDGIWRQVVRLGDGQHNLRLEVRDDAGLSGFSKIRTARIVTGAPRAPDGSRFGRRKWHGARADDDNITRLTTGLTLMLEGGHAGIDRRLESRNCAGDLLGVASPVGATPAP